MKTVVSGLFLAVLLFVGGWVFWQEAQSTRRVAEAHQRLATLHYEIADDVEVPQGALGRLPWPLGAATADMEVHRTTASYWLARYDDLGALLQKSGPDAPADPRILFVAANASFRASATGNTDRKAAVDRLEAVVQSYAEVLRKDPGFADAAYNYEFTLRMRDALARAPARGASRDAQAAAEDVSIDLPSGPTVHGRPGGPPGGTVMSDFKTITPMRYEEREEQADPGRGVQFKRKG